MKDEAFKVDHAIQQTSDLLSLLVCQGLDECKVTMTVRAINVLQFKISMILKKNQNSEYPV